MNIIKPGDIVFLASPLSHQAPGDLSKELGDAFRKNINDLNDILPRLGVDITWVSLSVGAPNSTPEVLFVYRKDEAKTCLCGD